MTVTAIIPLDPLFLTVLRSISVFFPDPLGLVAMRDADDATIFQVENQSVGGLGGQWVYQDVRIALPIGGAVSLAVAYTPDVTLTCYKFLLP